MRGEKKNLRESSLTSRAHDLSELFTLLPAADDVGNLIAVDDAFFPALLAQI